MALYLPGLVSVECISLFHFQFAKQVPRRFVVCWILTDWHGGFVCHYVWYLFSLFNELMARASHCSISNVSMTCFCFVCAAANLPRSDYRVRCHSERPCERHAQSLCGHIPRARRVGQRSLVGESQQCFWLNFIVYGWLFGQMFSSGNN